MIDDAARNGQSNATEPHSAGEDVVAVDGGNLPETKNFTSVGDSFVAACKVRREADGSISFILPTGPNSSLVVLGNVPWKVCEPTINDVVRLPIADIWNPGVALVVRPSLERLVKAARHFPECFRGQNMLIERHELEAALEPFAEIGK